MFFQRVRAVLGLATFGVVAIGFGGMALANSVESPTYTQHVAPIFNENCAVCHRPGDIAPMSLLTYDEVRPWVKSILKNVQDQSMPPWHADPGYGPFKNDRRLSQDEIDTIVLWAKQGAARGPKKDTPPVPEFDEGGWRLGEPDLIVELGEAMIPGSGPDQFLDMKVALDIDEDKWITAIEVMPSDREVVHHVIIWKAGETGQSGQGWLGAWAAGADPLQFPEGTGRLLKKGASIIGDMHYHPTDTDRVDNTKIGFHFAKAQDIEKELVNLWVMNDTFQIPAGDDNYQAESTFTFAQDSHILALAPHMHYRGKDFKYTMTYPDGTSEELLKVSKYDFNWQTQYDFETPVAAPKGTRIDCVAHWDNSTDNPNNPDPTKDIRFGVESYDEMMIGFVDYVVDEGIRPVKEDPVARRIQTLLAKDPGQVFSLSIPQGGSMQHTALYIPLAGDGGWHVPFGGGVARARVYDIVWDGDSFEAMAAIPNNLSQLKGTVDRTQGVVKIQMTSSEGMTFPMQAKIETE